MYSSFITLRPEQTVYDLSPSLDGRFLVVIHARIQRGDKESYLVDLFPQVPDC